MSMDAFILGSGALTKLVAATSSTSVAATQVCTGSEQGILLSNPSTVAIYVSLGSSTISAAAPTTSTPATGVCLPPSALRTFAMPGGPTKGWVSAVTSAGAAAPGLFATPGSGR